VLAPPELVYASVKLLGQYGDPVWAIEDNEQGQWTLDCAQDLQYRQLYHREIRGNDPVPGRQVQPSTKLGWHTDSNTRPVMWGELAQAVKAMAVVVPSEEGLSQMFSVIKNPNNRGRPEAIEGQNDDYPTALAIAWQIRGSAVASAGRVRSGEPITLRRW